MSEAMSEVWWLGRWYGLWTWDAIRQTYRDMPGPWWVKLVIVIICLAIPGPQDELLLVLASRAFRAWRKRQAGKSQKEEGK